MASTRVQQVSATGSAGPSGSGAAPPPGEEADFRLPADAPGWLTLLLLILLGLAGNYFKFTLFFNADFIFGSIFAMVALQGFGLGMGAASALIINLPLFTLWGHPYATLIMTLEVVVVGWLKRRRGLGFIQGDGLFWLVVGMPLVFVFYHLVMKVPLGNTLFIMAKDMMNGLVNVLAARVLFLTFTNVVRKEPVEYRDSLYTTLVFFVLAPALLLVAIESRRDFAATDRQTRATLGQDSFRMNRLMSAWVERRRQVVLELASLAAREDPARMQEHLEQALNSDGEFLRIGQQDAGATIVAYAPLLDELGQRNLGRNFKDRPYYATVKRTLRPMLSEVVMGRLGVPRPMVTIIAPIVREGRYLGCITGILNLARAGEYLGSGPTVGGTFYTLLDRNGKVIMTNRADNRIMEPLTRGLGRLERIEGQEPMVRQWVPDLPANTPAIERWRRSFYVADSAVGDWSEWKLILELPMAPFQKALFDRYSRVLFLLLGVLGASLVIAEYLSRRMTRSLEALGDLTRNLPERLAAGGEDVAWPESRILESGRLIANFKLMAHSLAEQFDQAHQTNLLLEQRVAERTRELQESEASYRNQFEENSSVMLLVSPSDGTILGANDAAIQFYGYPRERMLGMPIAGINTLPAAAVAEAMGSIQAVSGKRFQFRHRLADGSFREVEVSSSRIRTGTRDVLHSIVHDITPRIRAEEENARLQAQLLQSQKMESLGTLAGGIAHDMNNVLAAILSLASAHLHLQPTDSPTYPAFETIRAAATRGGDMVKRLLSFARQRPSAMAAVDLNALLKEQARLLERTLLNRITLELDLAEALDPIEGDEGALANVIMNLCVNAVDAMGDGGTLALRSRNTGAGQVEIRVEDSGCGMPREVLAKAMDPFFTTKEMGKGTGLGLAMVYTTVLAHRGKMDLHSEPGRGTQVVLQFPAKVQAPSGPAPGPRPAPLTAASSREVLLIDDDELIQISSRTVLEALGHSVRSAACGEDALALLAQGYVPELIILDMNMPGLGGQGTLPRLREHLPSVPVLLATGRTDQRALDLIAAHPRVTLLAKPFTLEDLQVALAGVGGDSPVETARQIRGGG